MTIFLVSAFGVFGIAFAVGWVGYKWFFWNVVDLLYYPLAAVGVVLLFLANDVQRELYDVTQLSEEQHTRLSDIQGRRPSVRVPMSEGLLLAHLEQIMLIQRWIELCKDGPSAAEARCLAAKSLDPHVASFLRIAQGKFSSFEERMLSTCDAGDTLLAAIGRADSMSSLVSEKFLAAYARLSAAEPHYLASSLLDSTVKTFHDETLEYVRQIQRLAFKETDSSALLLLDIRKAEIDYGEMLLRGLFPCATAPRRELGHLRDWTSSKRTQEQHVAELEQEREHLKASPPRHPTAQWLQLNLWPIVLIAALALKFAKGSAALRNARKS